MAIPRKENNIALNENVENTVNEMKASLNKVVTNIDKSKLSKATEKKTVHYSLVMTPSKREEWETFFESHGISMQQGIQLAVSSYMRMVTNGTITL